MDIKDIVDQLGEEKQDNSQNIPYIDPNKN